MLLSRTLMLHCWSDDDVDEDDDDVVEDDEDVE